MLDFDRTLGKSENFFVFNSKKEDSFWLLKVFMWSEGLK